MAKSVTHSANVHILPKTCLIFLNMSIISKQPVDNENRVIMPSPGSFVRPDLYSRRQWRRVQYLADKFWSRWRKEFLSTLQARWKWTTEKKEFRKKWYCFDSNRWSTKQLASGMNFGNQQRWKQCCLKSEIVDRWEKVKLQSLGGVL